jgi:DEAD/DEAH box helicase domain-containing protein
MAATSALELGMDVGDADAAILAGFPGTITRFKQRVGRVGRKGQDAYAVFVAQSGPLDQYYAQNPKLYLEGMSEGCYANWQNEHVRSQHILAACRDRAVVEEELMDGDANICKKLIEGGMLRPFGDALIPTKEGQVRIREMSMRNAGRRVKIYDESGKRFLGERELSMAIGELYEGAIYLIGGKKYIGLGMDADAGMARLRRYDDEGGQYTQAIKEKNAQIIEVEEESWWNGIELKRGKVHISENVGAYMVKDAFSGEIISKRELDAPLNYEFDTSAFWADWEGYCDGTERFAEGLHALEHVSIAMMPAISGADGAEIGGISFPTGRIVYYEGVEGGSGLSEIVMPRYEECIQMSLSRLETCKCEKGCPSCILSAQCANSNYCLDKESALELCKKSIKNKK